MRRGEEPDLNERLERSRLKQYLLADEIPILAQHQHWAALWKLIVFGIAGPLVLAVLAFVLPADLDVLNPFLLLAWIVLFSGWALWKWYLWQRKWLVATDKRLLVNYGLLRQGVSMISLARVVDLTYTRSTFGQLLGYGTLERESQKHPHSLHDVRWVKNPDSTYLTICAAIFNLQDRMFGMEQDEHFQPPDDSVPHPPGSGRAPGSSPRPSDHPGESGKDHDPGVIQIHYGVSQHSDRGPWRNSSGLGPSVIRDADTGPIPYRPSSTDEGDWQSTTDSDDDSDSGQDHDGH